MAHDSPEVTAATVAGYAALFSAFVAGGVTLYVESNKLDLQEQQLRIEVAKARTPGGEPLLGIGSPVGSEIVELLAEIERICPRSEPITKSYEGGDLLRFHMAEREISYLWLTDIEPTPVIATCGQAIDRGNNILQRALCGPQRDCDD